MCLTIPLQIKKVQGQTAELADGRQVSIGLLSKIKAGDWVLANADLAIRKISAREAKGIKAILSN